VVGTSALVHPAAGLATSRVDMVAASIEINVADTPLTGSATVSVAGPLAAIVPDLLAS
jgi:NAD-dependent SIR2 family protein deacetylase